MIEALINDLLDFAKVANSTFTMSPEYFNLPEVIYEAFEIV